MKRKSLWQDVKYKQNLETQNGNLTCDILIIGGGMAGISTAFELKDCKKQIILIDKGKIGFGVSSKSTGKLNYLQELPYHKLEEIFDYKTAKTYLDSQREAIEIARKRMIQYQIDCNFETLSSYTFTNKESDLPKFKKEEAFFQKAKIPYQTVDSLPISFPMCYGIRVDDTAVFHPVKYLLGLATILKNMGFKIYEKTMAQTLEQKEGTYLVTTNHGLIRATTVIVCTHYPFFVIPGWIPLRTHIEKDYVCATPIEKEYNFTAITPSSPTHSIRFHNDEKSYLIYCGNSLKTNKGMNEEKEHHKLKKEFQTYFHQIPEYLWSTHDIMTNDSLPFIGRLKKEEPNLLIATGFNTWGMTNGILSGKILADLVLEKENPYVEIFRPDRSINLKKVESFFSDSYQNASSILKTKVNKQKSFYPDSVKFITENGKNIGVYTDEKGKEHKVHNLCPHMKCSLIFNSFDKTWDCPCHGSRFDIDGNVLEGPSVYSISYKK